MMTSREIWAPLAAGSHDARVVVRTASGEEVDVKSVKCYTQRCVIEMDDPVHSVGMPDVEVITSDQISDLLDANTADVDECTAMLQELETLGVHSVSALLDALTS